MTGFSDVINDLKQTTIAQVIRQVFAIGVAVGSVWWFTGPILESYADDAFVKMMEKNGVSPKAFTDVTKKVGEIDKKTDELATDNDKIRGDIGAVKRQNEDLLKQQEQTTKLVERLLEIQLRRNWQ